MPAIIAKESSAMFIETIIERAIKYKMAYIDFFSGFGGVTHGLERASEKSGEFISTVIACLNHDPNAIHSHRLNYPHCLHIEEDVRGANVDLIVYMIEEIRRRSGGRTKICVWFSHECTHHSGAAGGTSRDADSRSLPEELERYIQLFNPDAIWIENVKEFLDWGPLQPKRVKVEFEGLTYTVCPVKLTKKRSNKKATGKKLPAAEPIWVPVQDRKGEDYRAWRSMVMSYGYEYEHRILNCADYGVPTTRKRLFIQFAKPEMGIYWSKPTHAKEPTIDQKPWIPIRECLDLDDHGPSLFETTLKVDKKSKKLVEVPRVRSDKTFRRVYRGAVKHIEPQLQKELDEYLKFVSMSYGTGVTDVSPDQPCPTMGTKNSPQVYSVENYRQMVMNYFGQGGGQSHDIGGTTGALLCNPKQRLMSFDRGVYHKMIAMYYGGPTARTQSLSNPSNTLTTNPMLRVLTVHSPFHRFVTIYNSSEHNHSSVNLPSKTLTTMGRLYPVTVIRPSHVMSTNYDNVGGALTEPSHVITSNRKWHYVISMQFNNLGQGISVPSATLIAKMDKKPNYLVTTADGGIGIGVGKDDGPGLVALKKWMAKWGITDIFMRELTIKEMLKITSMPEDYKMKGSKSDKKKFIGNAVPSEIVTALITGWYMHHSDGESIAA